MKDFIELSFAKKSEIEWINNCYDRVEFVHSDLEKEIIAIARMDREKVGLGRLVKIDKNHLELGGIYVLEPFRGKKIANEIIGFLLNQVKDQTVYCIPFEHLISLYKKYGFVDCCNFEQVPKEILQKYNWCKEKYSTPTTLLILNKKA